MGFDARGAATTRRSIDLANSCFVPDAMAPNALVAAAQRGVKVRIVVPGKHIDSDPWQGPGRR
jgi:cardiolipin synthase A/B